MRATTKCLKIRYRSESKNEIREKPRVANRMFVSNAQRESAKGVTFGSKSNVECAEHVKNLMPHNMKAELQYADQRYRKKKGAMPLPRPTNSSRLLQQKTATNAKIREASKLAYAGKKQWKMDRFSTNRIAKRRANASNGE